MTLRLLLCAVASATTLSVTDPSHAEAAQPRIGLVLGGGGARGAAHIGVLEVLERLRVPVDCVAGTSMGALVAGAWSAGLTPAQMRTALARADWFDMFQDNPDYTELNHRNKRLAQKVLPGSELGVSRGGLTTPPGIVAGQKIKLFFNRLVRDNDADRLLQDLGLPVSLVATDLANGERVVLREGSLALAMRASMSVPGLMAPAELEGRKLVDGGLVDNLPVSEVRQRCAADHVIAVNVGSPLLRPEEVQGMIGVAAQVINILTEQNVRRSLDLMGAADILIQPDLSGIGAADFERHADAAERGERAANAMAARLGELTLSPAAYAAWQARRLQRIPQPQVIDAIEVAGLRRVPESLVRRHITQPLGQTVDVDRLDRDLLRVYGDGFYETVDYRLVTVRERHLLRITPIEKPWGPAYLRMGFNLNSNARQGSTYGLRAVYQKTMLNRLGGELLVDGEFGSRQALAVDWYQPVDGKDRFFVEMGMALRRELSDLFIGERRIAEYRLGSGALSMAAGYNVGLLGQAKLGWREMRQSYRPEIGTPGLLLGPHATDRGSAHYGGWFAVLDLDQRNRLQFPSQGWALRLDWFDARQPSYSRLDLDARGILSWGDTVFNARLAHTASPRGRLPGYDPATLGGFLNLSAYATGQLRGDEKSYGHLRIERIMGRMPAGLRGDLRLGLALEAGRIRQPYLPAQNRNWLDSLTLYAGGDSPAGPIFVGLGLSSSGASNAYLFVGTP